MDKAVLMGSAYARRGRRRTSAQRRRDGLDVKEAELQTLKQTQQTHTGRLIRKELAERSWLLFEVVRDIASRHGSRR